MESVLFHVTRKRLGFKHEQGHLNIKLTASNCFHREIIKCVRHQ